MTDHIYKPTPNEEKTEKTDEEKRQEIREKLNQIEKHFATVLFQGNTLNTNEEMLIRFKRTENGITIEEKLISDLLERTLYVCIDCFHSLKITNNYSTYAGYCTTFDEFGRKHHHDENDHVIDAECGSCGHKFKIRQQDPCPSAEQGCSFKGFLNFRRI